MEKGLLTQLGELFDRYRSEQRLRTRSLPTGGQITLPYNRFARIFRIFIPNLGTLILVAVLLAVNNTGALSLLALNTTAASTGTIAYQGRLADSGGSPITATVNMIFRLYSASISGTPIWEEQWTGSNSVQVSDGLFNVMLGSVNPILPSVIASNANLFLGITVGTDSEMNPRVQLGSVPFATQALTVPDGSITTAKLAADVVLEPLAGSITVEKLADGSVTQKKAPFAAMTYWGGDSTPDPNMKSVIITTVFDSTGANSRDVDITLLGFTSRPLGICQISDTSLTASSFFCSYSWDSSSNTAAHIRLYPKNGTGAGPLGNTRITLFLMGS